MSLYGRATSRALNDAYGHGHAGAVEHPIEIEPHLPPQESLQDKLIRDRTAMYEAMDAEDEALDQAFDLARKTRGDRFAAVNAVIKNCLPFLGPDTKDEIWRMAHHYWIERHANKAPEAVDVDF